MAESGQDYRLPTNVTPTHYDLKILTDLEDLKFEGVVDIQCVFCVHLDPDGSHLESQSENQQGDVQDCPERARIDPR